MLDNTELDKDFLQAIQTIASELTLIRKNTDKLLDGRGNVDSLFPPNVEALLKGIKDAFTKVKEDK